MEKYFKHMAFIYLFALLPGIINFANSLYANELTTMNLLASGLFLFCCMGYGFYCGSKNMSSFIIFNFAYWAISMGIIFIGDYIDLKVFTLLAVSTSVIPMYGLRYFLSESNINDPMNFGLLIFIILMVSLFGYFIGKMRYQAQQVKSAL